MAYQFSTVHMNRAAATIAMEDAHRLPFLRYLWEHFTQMGLHKRVFNRIISLGAEYDVAHTEQKAPFGYAQCFKCSEVHPVLCVEPHYQSLIEGRVLPRRRWYCHHFREHLFRIGEAA